MQPAPFAGFPLSADSDWGRARYAVMPALFAEQCARWEHETRSAPSRRVFYQPHRAMTWMETSLPADRLCDGLAHHPQLLIDIARVTGFRPDPSATMAWLNRYRPGDEVPEHTDDAGDCQLLICLQAPPDPDRGGQTVIAGREVRLATGDALLWRASRLPHRMTRIEGPLLGPSGAARVVCVFRFFAGAAPTA